jgi:hypothetical protein
VAVHQIRPEYPLGLDVEAQGKCIEYALFRMLKIRQWPHAQHLFSNFIAALWRRVGQCLHYRLYGNFPNRHRFGATDCEDNLVEVVSADIAGNGFGGDGPAFVLVERRPDE